MRAWLKLTLCATATIVLAWGVVRSLVRSAPITADWGGLGFVAATLALMVVGIAATCVCVFRTSPHVGSSGFENDIS